MNPIKHQQVAHEEAVARIANRVALLTIAGLCSFLLAAVAVPLAFQSTESTAVRIVASTPVPVGLGIAVAVRAARAQLRLVRGEDGDTGGGSPHAASLGEPGEPSSLAVPTASARPREEGQRAT